MAKREREMILEVLTQYFTGTYLHYNVVQVESEIAMPIVSNPRHFILENKAVYFSAMAKDALTYTKPALLHSPSLSFGHGPVFNLLL